MPDRERKSVLRSIRIGRSLQGTLERDAASKGISVNALVTSILTRYAEWDRFADRFGFVTIQESGYSAMFDALPDEKIDQLGAQVGAQNPRELTLFIFKRLGWTAFQGFLELAGKYARTVQYEVDQQGSEVTLLIHHRFGARHSRYLEQYFVAAIHSVVGVVPRAQVGRSSIAFRFRVPPEAPSPTG